ncbi:MAG: HAF repeat-containing protein [Deltaproteobacteria bacterium]|nr:HAF repeat-containing protein [Deltaproteobacteria bacterium]
MRKTAFCVIIIIVGMFLLGARPAAAAPSYTYQNVGVGGPTFGAIYAYGLSGVGQVAGSDGGRAFLYNGAIHDLGMLPDPYNVSSNGYAVNAAEQVAGCSWGPSFGHAFLYSGGVMHNLGTLVPAPGDGNSLAYGINDAGQVVGESFPNGGAHHAFLYGNGVMQDLNNLVQNLPANTVLNSARAINTAGQVAGSAAVKISQFTSHSHAFLYSGGNMQDLGTLGGDNSTAYAISTTGLVAGKSEISSTLTIPPTHAFLWKSGVGMQDLGTLPAPYNVESQAYGVNAAGQVVGYSYPASGPPHAFLYSGGVMYDLNNLVNNLPQGVVFQYAYGINDRGQIIANAYLLTPVPPLSGLDMLLLD